MAEGGQGAAREREECAVRTGDIAAALRRMVSGTVEENVLMKHHTSMRVGGPADILVSPRDAASAVRCALFARSEGIPLAVIGCGTNLVVRDGGIRGIVLRPRVRGLLVDSETGRLVAGAGEMLSAVARAAEANGLSGLEPMAGIPGSLGGAIAMNAGAFDRALSELVEEMTVMEPSGEVRKAAAVEAGFAYRSSALRDRGCMVLSVTLRLSPGDEREISRKTRLCLEKRRRTQPLDFPSAGSVFKNPFGMPPAGKLLEDAGLKGLRIGDAQVSPLHANFIVNLGRAEAADVLSLMEKMRETVEARFSVDLEPEVVILGRDVLDDRAREGSA